MNTPPDLLKAIRTGQLAEVIAALDAGAPIELDDGKGDPGLPLAIACFMGHAGRTEVVKVLIEHGATVPEGMSTGLKDDELMLARWKAQHYGARLSATGQLDGAVIEEIQVGGCYGTSTDVLNAEMRRAVENVSRKK